MNRHPEPFPIWHPPLLTRAQKQCRALRLRREESLTFEKIGQRMGYSRERARVLVLEAERAERKTPWWWKG